MDVHYKPDAWQEMKEGIDQLTKEALRELTKVNDLLEEIESKIHSLDSDRSIHFQHTSQQGKINRLLDDYITLGNYCTQAGQVVSRHIDEPFYKDMDKFAGKMRDLSIRNYSTKNRIGSTSTTTMPNVHGYGMPQTITTKKDKITVDDIFKDSVEFDKVLRAQYKEIKQENPDAKLDYAEYRKLVPSMRGFEYKTREDEQKKLETWRDLVIGAGLIILTIVCPPAGLTAAALYGGLQLKSAYDGKDWGTGRKLSDAERAENGIFGALDAIPVLGTAVKGFKGLDSALSLAKLSKMQEAGKVFNPNTGKNVVQSLHNSKNIMLDRMKLGSLKVEKYGNDKMYQLGGKLAKSIDNMTAKTKSFEINEHGVITAKQGGTDFHSWVNKHHTESSKIIDDKIKGVEGSLDERILNNLGLNEESAAWFSNALKNEKIQPSEWTGKLICASGDGKHLTERELKYINQELKKGNHVDLDEIKSLREQASQLADDYATKIRSDEKWTQLTKEHAASKQPSTILGHELENAGIPRPPRHEAHHITPYNQGRLRKYIEKYGIDGNSAANGVFLPQNYSTNWPGQVTHSVWNNLDEKGNMMFRHGQEYIDYLEKKLKEIDKLDVRILSKADKKQEILSFLEETREGLLTGKIQFLYKD